MALLGLVGLVALAMSCLVTQVGLVVMVGLVALLGLVALVGFVGLWP